MHSKKIKILLIEDDPAEAGLIMQMLARQRQEYAVTHVRDLAEALSKLENFVFDCILIDLGFLESQVLETALTVKKHAQLTPVTILSNLDDEETEHKALEMGIQDYLIKEEINGTILARSIRYAIQRKHITEKLRESEERFASFMLHMPVAAWMKDREGRYVYANAEAERVFATPLASLLGKSDRDIFPEETVRQFAENDRWVLLGGESLQTVEVLRHRDGVEHHSIVNKFVVKASGGKAGFVAGIALDITDTMRESEEKFSKIFDAAPVGITISSLSDGRFIEINREGERLIGFCRDEVIGHTAQEFDVWKDPAERARMIDEVMKEGAVRDREITLRTKEGKFLQGLFSAALIDIGKRKHLVSLVSDISARKQAEEALEEANRELQTFNYSVAHDLRQPLNTVSGYCQAIKMLCDDRLGNECAGYLQGAYDSTMRMNQLIEALLNFSRMAHVELHCEMVDLSKVVRELAEGLRVATPERRVTFRIADGVMAYGAPDLLRVILGNLIGNAWKYTGIREEAVIEFGMAEIDVGTACFVRDNGPGFDMADAGNLFLPFQRLPGARKTGGFGIGLATVERIIRRHGGMIWAEGVPDKGATFWFTLPAKEKG